MANPIIKIKRGAVAPVATLQAGEFAIDQVAKNLYLGVEVGGIVSNEIVGGNGTFATHTDVAIAVSAGTGSLGTMSTQNADAVAITGGTIDGTTIGATTPSTGKFTAIETDNAIGQPNIFNNQTKFAWGISGVGSNPVYVASTLDLSIGSGIIDLGGFSGCAVKGLDAPVNDNDAARKKYVDDKVSALGSVFSYKGDLSAHMSVGTGPFELDNTDIDLTTGAYYRVDVAGTYNAQFGGADPSTPAPAVSFDLKVGDAIVKTSTGWQKIDNVDVVVSHEAGGEITVSGTEDTGYVVKLNTGPGSWKDSVDTDITDLETKTQNIDLAGTTSGTTHINGTVKIANIASGGGAALLTGSDIGIDIAASDGTGLVHAGLWYSNSAFVGYTNKMVLQGGTEVEVCGGGSSFPVEATLVTLNSTTVSGNAAGTTTLENFVIDGGVY